MSGGGGVVIRRASLDDAAGIAQVQVASWRTTYRGLVSDEYLAGLDVATRTERWREILARDDAVALVAEEGTAVGERRAVGFLQGGPNRWTDPPFDAFEGELNAIYLLHGRQRGGTGTRLARAFAEAMLSGGFSSCVVWVLERNPSRAFYERLGARLVGAAEIVIDGVPYPDVAYAWDDLRLLAGDGARAW